MERSPISPLGSNALSNKCTKLSRHSVAAGSSLARKMPLIIWNSCETGSRPSTLAQTGGTVQRCSEASKMARAQMPANPPTLDRMLARRSGLQRRTVQPTRSRTPGPEKITGAALATAGRFTGTTTPGTTQTCRDPRHEIIPLVPNDTRTNHSAGLRTSSANCAPPCRDDPGSFARRAGTDSREAESGPSSGSPEIPLCWSNCTHRS